MNWYGSIARRLVWLPVLLSLGACQFSQADLKDIEAKVGDTLPAVCAGIDIAWIGFQAWTSERPVKPELLVKANASYFAAKSVCANPPTDTLSAVQAAIKAYAAFKATIETAKNGNTGGASG